MLQTKPNAAPSAPTKKKLKERSRSWAVEWLNVGTVLLVGGLVLAGCGSEPPATDGGRAPTVAVGPSTSASTSSLSAEERDLLARAKGRTWIELRAAEVDAYLSPRSDSTSAILFWSPSTGAAGLRRIQSQIQGLNELGIRVALATPAGGNEREELIDLRESQLVVPAYTVPAAGDYAGLPGGKLPAAPAMLIRSSKEPEVFLADAQTPVSAYRELLVARAPD